MKNESLLTVRDAAEILQCCHATIRRAIRAGKLATSTLPGGRFRIKRSDLDAMLAAGMAAKGGGA